MISKKSMSIFVATFLVIGFFFLALPEKGYSGVEPLGCCEFEVKAEPSLFCQNIFSEEGVTECNAEGEFFEGEVCSINETFCTNPASNVPTLSEWGLIAMAGVLGIVGFMVMRRRKVTA